MFMHKLDGSATARSSVRHAAQKVATQKLIVSLMLPGDPALPYALTVLRQMEQSFATAENDAFANSNSVQLRPR